ncbi:MAG: hypothetical protein IKR58_06995 [Lachnospiraceae bacterium]|nr:hypothetical protein [Lachnospiraceae bacterium]
MAKRHKNKEGKTAEKKSFWSKIYPPYVIIFLVYVVHCAVFITAALWALRLSSNVTATMGVVRGATEPQRLVHFDSEHKQTKYYYASDLTVDYQDPETGEKATAIVRDTHNKPEYFPKNGTEVKINVIKSKSGNIVVMHEPKILYSAVIVFSVFAVVAATICIIWYAKEEMR